MVVTSRIHELVGPNGKYGPNPTVVWGLHTRQESQKDDDLRIIHPWISDKSIEICVTENNTP